MRCFGFAQHDIATTAVSISDVMLSESEAS